MDIVLILRVTAQVVVAIRIETGDMAELIEIGIPRTIAAIPSRVDEIAEIISTTIALLVTILILIAELKVGARQNRFAISKTCAIVPILGRGDGIATCNRG